MRSEPRVETRPIRILEVQGTLNRGGVETWLRHAVTRLPRDRYQCDFCTYRIERGAYADDLESHGSRLFFIALNFRPVAFLRFCRRFRQLLRTGRYDVVHAHGLLLVGFILFLSRLEKVPARIAHAHSTRNTRNAPASAERPVLALSRFLARRFSTRGVACSAEAALALFGNGWRREAKYQLLHCGIDLAPFEREPESKGPEALNIPPGVKVIGHAGSFSPAKNHRFLIEVAAIVFRQRPEAALLLAGDGELQPAIEQRCRELGIRSRVFFTGVSRSVPNLMKHAMDVLVMPSLHEGLPLTLLEAQAAGLPCLVSDVVSRETMVAEGALHFLPLSAGAEAWARAVLSLLEAPRVERSLEAMRQTDFDITVSSRQIGELYDEAGLAEAAV